MLCLKLFILLSGITVAFSRRANFYRKDYKYFTDFDAFYKLHWDKDGLSYNAAFLSCDDEGAKLFYPREKNEWTTVKNLISSLGHPPNISDIIVGIHDSGFGEFITVDGESTPTPLNEAQEIAEGHDCVLMDIETGKLTTDSCAENSTTLRPYVCKKVDEKPCPTIDPGYIYKVETKKCYKISQRKRTWNDAMHTCLMEGGKLVVVENPTEARIIHDMMPESVFYYYAGFRRTVPKGDYYTVNGQKLEEKGYFAWYDRRTDLLYDCGMVYTLHKQLYTKTQNCNETGLYVCEIPANQ